MCLHIHQGGCLQLVSHNTQNLHLFVTFACGVKNNIELAKTGWVDVVKRNIKKEIKDENINFINYNRWCDGQELDPCNIRSWV